MRLYNTLTRKEEELLSPEVLSKSRPFGIYSCGPTVQGPAHFGHARAAIIPDVLKRVLLSRGLLVRHVRNVTDVDDKIIMVANENNIDAAEVAEFYVRNFHSSLQRLNILQPNIEPHATGHIIQMIEMISTLIDKGHAYETSSGDVYFSVLTKADYGKLSGRNIEDMCAGTRIGPNEEKKFVADFALWKAAKEGEPAWSSPWGKGRPGWHIECSAMANQYFGENLDLHTGGNDLTFPHHENEIAQSEAATGIVPFAKHWLHNGMLNIDGEKMSKSLGNFITLDDALDRFGGNVLRLYYLQHHYRSPANFSVERLEESKNAWQRITTFFNQFSGSQLEDEPRDFECQLGSMKASFIDANDEVDKQILERVDNAFDEDLNTPVVVSILFETLKAGNHALASNDNREAKILLNTIEAICVQLGLNISDIEGSPSSDQLTDDLMEKVITWRTNAKKNKDFALADTIRDDLLSIGIRIEDHRDGTTWKLK